MHWAHPLDPPMQSKPSKGKGGFRITLYGLVKRQPKYYFKCYVTNCDRKFHALKDWKAHHIKEHKSLLSCLRCPKQFKKLSAFRAHRNNHVPLKLSCSVCGKSFAFPSSVQLHRRVHLTQHLFKCFAAGCMKQYKWRQDLHRHVQKHLKK